MTGATTSPPTSDPRTLLLQDHAEGFKVALSDYLGVSGIRGDWRGDRSGVLTVNRRIRFADITDGTSNTRREAQ